MVRKSPDFWDVSNSPVNSRYFGEGDNGSDNLANNHAQFIEFFHLPSSYFVTFKAFLTGFSDAYSSEWKKTSVYGRMDDIVTFVRTTRKIDVSFDVPAANYKEAAKNMTRMSTLVQMLYPSVEGVGMSAMEAKQGTKAEDRINDQIRTIKGSPLFKVKFLNWIKGADFGFAEAGVGQKPGEVGLSAESSGLLGYIDGFTFAPDMESGVFQNGLSIFPKLMTIVFTLNVIHEHDMGWEKSGVKNKMLTDPIVRNFPYGNNVFVPADRVASKMAEKQEKRFKELQKAQKKMLLGG